MPVEPLDGFVSFATHHCVTGSMLHVFRHAGLTVSEDMLLGLGAGVGFFYWHMKSAPPMLLGRGNVHKRGVEGLEIDASVRLGVRVERFKTSSEKKAQRALDEELAAGRPVMVQVDMAYLHYLGLPEDYHFGGHVIVVAGAAGDEVVVADRDEEVHEMPAHALRQARGSTHKPFPPSNIWYRFDFSDARDPTPTDVREAIAQNAHQMLHGPISNFGVRGIRKAAKLVPKWSNVLDAEALSWACINNWIFIDATGGTGGGMFRLMYGRFLHEAATICDEPQLAELGDACTDCGNAWDGVGGVFKSVGEGGDAGQLAGLRDALMDIADREERLWTGLVDWSQGTT